MKRFILITGIGAVALLGSHVSLSLGLHPDQLSSFGVLAQGCIVLVLGTSLFASGMLGLAENYEKTASRLFQLLNERQVPGDDQLLVVRDEGELAKRNEAFWTGYQRTAAGIILFLAGFLTLMLTSKEMSLSTYYMMAVAAGIGILGIAAALLALTGLRGIRRSHVAIESSMNSLSLQPRADEYQFPSQPLVETRRLQKRTIFATRSRPSNLRPRHYPGRHAGQN